MEPLKLGIEGAMVGKNVNWELRKLELRETHENMNLEPWKV
jgi:hypothetical protein